MPPPLVYVVVVNWNLRDDTAECLESLLLSDYANYRVLVVDNGSQDGSPEYLQARFPHTESIKNPTNLGFAKANNIGIRFALEHGAEHVFLLNNDTTVAPNMLSKVVVTALGSSQIGVVAPKILYYAQRDKIWHLGGRASRWLPVPRTLGQGQLDDGRYSQPFEVDMVAFCGALIKRSLLERIGLLDELFVFSYEDADFCYRARAAGYRVVCQPQAEMWHKVSVSVQRNISSVRYLHSRGRALFYRRYPHGPHPWLTAGYLCLSTARAAVASLLQGDITTARAGFRGLYDGYRFDLRSN